MVSSGATTVRTFSYIIPRSLVMATVLCRKERPWSLKLCRDRRVRKLPTCKNRPVRPSDCHLLLPAKRAALPAFFVLLTEDIVPLLALQLVPSAFPYSCLPPYNLRMDNKSIARILRDPAQLLEIDGAVIGRYRSYEKAAELISGMHESIEEMAKDPDKLEELPGIGERMAEHLQEILKTGDYSLRQKLLKKYPVTLLDILHLQSLGPKKVAFLWSNFRAATVADVEKLALEGKLREVPGFGEKSEQNILRAVETHKRSTGRFRLDTAEAAAASIIAHT